MTSRVIFVADCGKLTLLRAFKNMLMNTMIAFAKVSVDADGPTLHYRCYRARLPPPQVDPSVPHSYDYEAGDLWTCGDSHWFWNGAEWIRWTGDEQHHPDNERIVLYQQRNGLVKWKVMTL
jgi:hypothetical protein